MQTGPTMQRLRSLPRRMGLSERTAVALRERARRFVPRLLLYVLLFDLAFVFLYPFMFMIVQSIKSPTDLADFTIQWLPNRVHSSNYVLAYASMLYLRGLLNSVIVTSIGIVGHLASCSLIAYGFARFRFPGRNLLFILVIVTLIIPVQTIIVPLYIQFSRYGMVGTHLPFLVPTFFGFGLRGGLFIFIFRQFFLGMPKELEDAALIDGCSYFRIYWNIIMPSAQPAILVSVVLAMVWHWNDYFEPAIYIWKPQNWPLTVALPGLIEMVNLSEYELMQLYEEFGLVGALSVEAPVINEAVVMAATFMVTFPVLLVFAFLQRQFMQGIERTGLVE